MREIVTLQIGEPANYLGTHFWNVQESYFTSGTLDESPVNHDIHFRPGIGADFTETFTPRTLIYDFKPRFGTLRQRNELYEFDADPQSDALADPTTTVHRQPPVPPHSYQQALSEGVEPPRLKPESIRYWSDYNRVFYNPKSIVQVYEDDLGPQQSSFNDWSHGAQLFTSLNRGRNLLDEDFRPLVEECDQMQGIQVLATVDNGWGGFTSSYLDELRDEYGKSCTVVWGTNSHPLQLTLQHLQESAVNQARSLASISPQATLYVPLTREPGFTPVYIDLNQLHLWQVSALQCCAMETAMLPAKLRSSSTLQPPTLHELVLDLGTDERQRVAEASVRFQPHGAESAMTYGPSAQPHYLRTPCSLLPSIINAEIRQRAGEYEVFGQLNVLRGSHCDKLAPYPELGSRTHRWWHQPNLAFPVLDSFPALYRTEASQPRSLSVRTSLTKSSTIAEWAYNLHTSSQRGLKTDDREIIFEELENIIIAYDTERISDADSDD